VTSPQELPRFAESFTKDFWKAPGKTGIARTIIGADRFWKKEGDHYHRELAIHSILDGIRFSQGDERKPKLDRVQRITDVDLKHKILTTEDAGCGLWNWLWHCATPIGGEPSVQVHRLCHDKVRAHILNWDDALLRFAAGALEPLNGIHDLGLVHFDLHFANWCLDARPDSGPGEGERSHTYQITCKLALDQPALIDLSESLWQSKVPLENVPRHVAVLLDRDGGTYKLTQGEERVSPLFRNVAQEAYAEAMKHSPEFQQASERTRWDILTSESWCRKSRLAPRVTQLLKIIDWREDLYQLGYLLRSLLGTVNTVDNERVRRGPVLELDAYGQRKPETALDGQALSPPESQQITGIGKRVVAPLPPESELCERDKPLRRLLVRLIERLMGYSSSPSRQERPHLELIKEIENALNQAGYKPHSAIKFTLVGPNLPTPGLLKRKAGTPFRDIDAPWCPQVVAVSPGDYKVGRPGAMQLIRLGRAIAVGVDPVTVAQYSEFMANSGRKEPHWRVNSEDYRLPMTNITAEDAEEYLAWLNQRFVHQWPRDSSLPAYRLLSSEEWEICCRAGGEKDYTLGHRYCDDVTPDQAVYKVSAPNKKGERWKDSGNRTNPIEVDHARNKVNQFGLRGMHGNVFEMVHPGQQVHLIELRGGGYASAPRELAAHFKKNVRRQDYYERDTGFRICRDMSDNEFETT
jgi:hypothetical protein